MSVSVYRDLTMLVSGSIGSQVILLLATPILSRIYKPEAFGYLSIYMSIMLVCGVASTGKYELAVSIPESEEEGVHLAQATLLINSIASVLLFVLFFSFQERLAGLVNVSKDESALLLFIPLSIWLNAYISIFTHWVYRKKLFAVNSLYIVFSAICLTLSNIAISFTEFRMFGLVYSYILSQFLSIGFYLFMLMRKNVLLELLNIPKSLVAFFSTMKKFSSFPRYQLFSQVLLTLSAQLVPILLARFYAPNIVGQFSLANRVSSVPVVAFGSSFSNIFKIHAIDDNVTKGNCYSLFMNLFKKLALISFLPFLILVFWGEYIFAFFLGENWALAGRFASLLSIYLFLDLVTSSFNTIFQITGTQKKFTLFQILNIFIVIGALVLGGTFFTNPLHTILLFVVLQCFYCVLLFFTIKTVAKGI
jgi:teichuronic acid exporter